jgi:hypothetical protein
MMREIAFKCIMATVLILLLLLVELDGKQYIRSKNGNGKRKFVFFGRQTISGNRRLLFQQTCPSMYNNSF